MLILARKGKELEISRWYSDDDRFSFFSISPKIIEEKRGEGGFGYDPIFIPDGYDLTFAELPLRVKNKVSHRGKAVMKMVEYLSPALSEGEGEVE